MCTAAQDFCWPLNYLYYFLLLNFVTHGNLRNTSNWNICTIGTLPIIDLFSKLCNFTKSAFTGLPTIPRRWTLPILGSTTDPRILDLIIFNDIPESSSVHILTEPPVFSSSTTALTYSGWPKGCHKSGGSVQNLRQKSTTKTYFFYIKQINITWNVQYLVEKYFLAINECSWHGMDAYKFRTYSINRDLQMPQAASTNSARVLIKSVSICSFSIQRFVVAVFTVCVG